MASAAETILQFGSGKFLRAFADLFIDQANRTGQDIGRVVVVQSTGESRAAALNQQGGRYHVLVRGLENAATIDRIEEVQSVSRALIASTEWQEILAVARSPALHAIISNTAEVGYTPNAGDKPTDSPPRSFPAKLLLVLQARFDAGRPGVTILPCELHENNADLLLGLVLQLADAWSLSPVFRDWLRTSCRWRNTLVDRIVVNKPTTHPLLQQDALLCVAEPFAFWGIEIKEGGNGGLFPHPAVLTTTDVKPYFLRKVRILNAAHTAMVCKAMPRGIATVREAVADSEIAAWLNRLLFDEIVPTVKGRVDDAEKFAYQVLERFRNPFLDHQFKDIASYHEAKVKIRLIPTRAEFVDKFGRTPPLLDEAIAASPPGS
ncbi:MAG TPA: altronate dehydrogenase [Gemmataceae bacterium]|jgi:tagaturonate reductase|nr:altronate dehydrogenase [Gemmataceae bacterium]